jgi:hypothetical protein
MRESLFDRQQLGELTTGVGAVVLGIGLGALIGAPLRGFIAWLVILGVLLQGWGILERRRWVLSATRKPPAWWRAIYAACWLGLAAIAVFVLVGQLR